MAIWRYKAVAISGPAQGLTQRGEMAAETAAEVRAALRRVRLQVLDVRPVRHTVQLPDGAILAAIRGPIHRHLRARRGTLVAEYYDSLATMLESGMPLLESIETMRRSLKKRRSSWSSVLVGVGESLRSGSSLSEAMATHPSWFDSIEIAIIRAGQHTGDLSSVLRRLADRHERGDELLQKLTSALAYPVIVTAVATGVVVFLSTKTLPDLVQILADAEIAAPPLTMGVTGVGQFLAEFWWLMGLGILVVPIAGIAFRAALMRFGFDLSHIFRTLQHLRPMTMRRIALAESWSRLADLTRAGVPVVEALRIIAPTAPGSLRLSLLSAAGAVERGEDLPGALDDEHWFDAEFRQLLAIGQASGELDELLDRIADRYARQARRLIDRLAALLEPAVILALAFLIGIVVMAAILPLVKLQEVI